MTAQRIVIGAGGHAVVVADALQEMGLEVVAFLEKDTVTKKVSQLVGLPVLISASALASFDPVQVNLVNGIGDIQTRKQVQLGLLQEGWTFTGLIHPTAVISKFSEVATDAQIHANAVVQANTKIGNGVIINSNAVIEHDCTVGEWAHIAPSATICGGCVVSNECLVGSNATLVPFQTVEKGSLVRAGQIFARKNISKN